MLSIGRHWHLRITWSAWVAVSSSVHCWKALWKQCWHHSVIPYRTKLTFPQIMWDINQWALTSGVFLPAQSETMNRMETRRKQEIEMRWKAEVYRLWGWQEPKHETWLKCVCEGRAKERRSQTGQRARESQTGCKNLKGNVTPCFFFQIHFVKIHFNLIKLLTLSLRASDHIE